MAEQPIAATGTVVWLPGYGEVKVFRTVAPNGDATHWATNDLGLDDTGRLVFAELSWSIEEYPRFTVGVTWFAAKTAIVRDAVRASLANPRYGLPKGATA